MVERETGQGGLWPDLLACDFGRKFERLSNWQRVGCETDSGRREEIDARPGIDQRSYGLVAGADDQYQGD